MMRHGSMCLMGLISLCFLASCASCEPAFRECDPVAPTLLAALPERLSQTELFEELGSERLAPGVRPYAVRFPLWSDGASKRRWIFVPPGAQIDTADPDAWNFPRGTKLWKEFTRDGVRVETRLLLKHDDAPGAWTPMTYVWREDGEAYATRDGVSDARGTAHDVPAVSDCQGCHGGKKSGALGFSAIQLFEAQQGGEAGALTLGELRREGLLSAPLPGVVRVPGDATEVAALGYLHANCSHCHNQDRPMGGELRCFDPQRDFDFSLYVGALDSVSDTAVYRTAIDALALRDGGDAILYRVQTRNKRRGMPALGTEEVDEEGVALLTRWIDTLQR